MTAQKITRSIIPFFFSAFSGKSESVPLVSEQCAQRSMSSCVMLLLLGSVPTLCPVEEPSTTRSGSSSSSATRGR